MRGIGGGTIVSSRNALPHSERMGKTKMNALDVKASVAEMQSLVGLRLLNAYDIQSKLFLLKFGSGDHKQLVLIESGVRMHITELVREKPKMPSQFTFKLRKHIKSWRLDKITQWNGDRTIVMRFGTEITSFHLIVELYAKGNVILVDNDFVVLTLLRTHKDGDVKLQVKEKYVLPGGSQESGKVDSKTEVEQCDRLEAMVAELVDKANPQDSLRQVLAGLENFGPQLAEHAITVSGFRPNEKKAQSIQGKTSAELAHLLRPGLESAFQILRRPPDRGGFLIQVLSAAEQAAAPESPAASPQPSTTLTALQVQAVKYEDFSPVLLAQFSDTDRYSAVFKDTYGKVCDLFFHWTEMEKIDQHNEKKENVALSAKERFERDHNRRLQKLLSEEEKNMKKGRLIEHNADSVQQVIHLMNALLAGGGNWSNISQLVKMRAEEGHPVAYMIHKCNFESNSVTVLLEEEDMEDGEEDNDVEPVAVEILLTMSAQRNASRYFSMKKEVHAKLEKTLAATDKALAGAEKKGQRQAAKQGPSKREVLAQRKPLWFEKFHWFLTSAGNVVVAGRDNQQTDILVKRYMQPGDVFVHTDASKALPCVVKGVPGRYMAMLSVQEAGAMCVSRSGAWDSKASISAWWVHASQVSKESAGAGCFMNPGMFAIHGDRNYLKPMPLSVGCAVLFRVEQPQPPFDIESFAMEGGVDVADVVVPPDDTPARNSSSDSAEAQMLSSGQISPEPNGIAINQHREHNTSDTPVSPLAVDEKDNNSNSRATFADAAPSSCGSTSKKKGVSLKAMSQRSQGSQGSVNDSSEDTKSASQRSSHSSAMQASSGKRSKHKLKKIMKYQEQQDEADMAKAMTLLGNTMSKYHQEVTTAKKSKKSADDSLTSSSDSEQSDDGTSKQQAGKRKEVKFAEREIGDDDTEQLDATHDMMRKRTASMEDDLLRIADQMEKERDEIHYFTGNPSPNDAVLYAIPMCSPSSSVVKFKYHVDLTYGPEKKGAAASAIFHYFKKTVDAEEGLHPTHRSSIQHIDANETMTNQMIGNVKVHIAKLAALKEERKAAIVKEKKVEQKSGGGSKGDIHRDPNAKQIKKEVGK